MKKIIKSGFIVLAVAAIAGYGTYSYFSDKEVSNGNTFQAGSIDLSLGGDFTQNGTVNGTQAVMALSSNNNGRAMYNFTDLKPGDDGGGSFKLQVTSNDAFVCAKSTITSMPDGSFTEPEQEAGDVTNNDGELQKYLKFATFADLDDDGIYDTNEPINVGQYVTGHDSKGITAAEFGSAGWVSVADTLTPNTWLTTGVLTAGATKSAGMLYCFGDFITTGSLSTTQVTGCDGTDFTGLQNQAQTDSVIGSIEFYAVQTRNNPNFKCTDMNEKVGASFVNYPTPTCSRTVLANGSIQTEINNSSTSDTICVSAGTYTEDLTVDKDVTIVALNAPGSSSEALLAGTINIIADGVTIKGLDIDPVIVPTQGTAINVVANNVTIDSNIIKGITAPAQGSVKGIFVGDSTGSGVRSGLVISNNKILNITEGFGKGAYGILINYGSGSSATGSVSGPVIANNTIDNLSGGWAHAVGLEADTPGAMIHHNIISNLGSPAGTDKVGVYLEDNTGVATILINNNNFAPSVPFGVANNTTTAPGTVKAENNWWGDANPADNVFGNIDFTSFVLSAFPLN